MRLILPQKTFRFAPQRRLFITKAPQGVLLRKTWERILAPDDSLWGVAGRCLEMTCCWGEGQGTNTRRLLFDPIHKPCCYCRNSRAYRALRLVSQGFNEIISEHIFSAVVVLFDKDYSMSRLSDFIRPTLYPYAQTYIFLARNKHEYQMSDCKKWVLTIDRQT